MSLASPSSNCSSGRPRIVATRRVRAQSVGVPPHESHAVLLVRSSARRSESPTLEPLRRGVARSMSSAHSSSSSSPRSLQSVGSSLSGSNWTCRPRTSAPCAAPVAATRGRRAVAQTSQRDTS
eukprot:7382612-Prymnesium_polylepis.1